MEVSGGGAAVIREQAQVQVTHTDRSGVKLRPRKTQNSHGDERGVPDEGLLGDVPDVVAMETSGKEEAEVKS